MVGLYNSANTYIYLMHCCIIIIIPHLITMKTSGFSCQIFFFSLFNMNKILNIKKVSVYTTAHYTAAAGGCQVPFVQNFLFVEKAH